MLSPLFTDHMVLQRGRPLTIGGQTQPDTAVTVTLGPHQQETRGDARGQWSLTLPAMEAGGPFDLTAAGGGQTRTVRDVLIGDVWIIHGHSNVEFPLRDADTAAAALAEADLPRLRLLRVPCAVSVWPRALPPEQTVWTPCGRETAAGFSAVGFHFGQRLLQEVDAPVGLIQVARGNSPLEAWTPMAALLAEADFRPILDRFLDSIARWPQGHAACAAAFVDWDRDTDRLEKEGRPLPGPAPRLLGPDHHWTPAGLYHAMVHPLTALPVRGVVSYLGAAAPERGRQYGRLFRHFIRAWRQAWNQPDLPVIYAQEFNFGPRRPDPGEHSWAELREAQALVRDEPHTAMAVLIDLGREDDIHPPNKQPVADRLAAAALGRAYGRDLPWSSPMLTAAEFRGNEVHLRVAPTYGSLRTRDGREPRGLAVSPGCDDYSHGQRGFVWAQARIQGDTLVVTCDRVPRPVAVRHAWAQNPQVNLVNAADLPLAPFRTDTWPGVTDRVL